VSLFVWLLPLDLSGMGGSTSRYATAGIALGVSAALSVGTIYSLGTENVVIYVTNTFKKPTRNAQSSVTYAGALWEAYKRKTGQNVCYIVTTALCPQTKHHLVF
jgi:hypothetical protein